MCCDVTGYSTRVLDCSKWSLGGEWRKLGREAVLPEYRRCSDVRPRQWSDGEAG